MRNKFNIDTSKMNFVIFTVINVTNNGKVNNPPNPPYIKTNKLESYFTCLTNELKKSFTHFNDYFCELFERTKINGKM